MYISGKIYHDDFPVAYRQWRDDGHCRLIHGYCFTVKIVFSCHELDERNWCVDFGGMKSLRGTLKDNLDHVLLVADDDPELSWFVEAEKRGIAKVIMLEHLGSECLSKLIFDITEVWLGDAGYGDRVQVMMVQLYENGKNFGGHINDQIGPAAYLSDALGFGGDTGTETGSD